jgi:hypothetical protein
MGTLVRYLSSLMPAHGTLLYSRSFLRRQIRSEECEIGSGIKQRDERSTRCFGEMVLNVTGHHSLRR